MALLSLIVGVRDSAGQPIPITRADGSSPPVYLQLDEGLSATVEENGATSSVVVRVVNTETTHGVQPATDPGLHAVAVPGVTDGFLSASGATVLASVTSTLRQATLTVGHANLTDSAPQQTLNLGAVLATGTVNDILGVSVALATPFTGGAASAVRLDIGASDDFDALIADANVFAASVGGQASSLPLGIAPHKRYASAAQLLATFRVVGANVVDLTAGALTIVVTYRNVPS